MKLYQLIFVLFVVSCGGGGGGGSAPTAPAPQNISVSLSASADSAEVNSSITLTWSSTLATSCSASGSWSGSKAASGSESITIGVGGSNSFSLSCSATGANSGSASISVNGLRYFDGKVFDGYIRGAEVFVDTNDNLALDANEASVSTDNTGGFSKLLFGNGTLVAKGGFDLDTGAELSDLTLVHKLEGYEASKLASPFTTLIAYMSDASTINAALGIDASINLLTTDPIPNLGEGIYDQMYEKGNQLTVLSYTLQNQAAADSSQLYFQAIADQLEESYAANQASVNIEDSAFISNVINKVEAARETTFSSEVKANLNTLLSTTIPLLKVYADASTTSSVQRFAFSTLQNDVQDSTVIGSSTSTTLTKYDDNVFEYVASDQGIDEAAINPTYNNAPTISSLATFSAAENQTSIGSVLALDADGDSLTYSISGSEINISSSGVLTFAIAPDYETKNSYTATVTVSDGTDSVTQAISINISNLNDNNPVISSSATFSLAENNTAIGFISVSDADGDSLTYSISGSEISISGAGQISFATAPDFETKNSYTATVTVSDGTNSTTQNITVNVTDVDETMPNEAPTIISSATFSAAENQTSIGSVSASDPDGDSLTYSISGSEINISSSGVLTFATAPDYETKNSYSATVTVSDGTASVTQSITVNVTDINEAPTISSSATFSAAENQTSIGSVSASDADGDSLTYSISGSEINISSSGSLFFAAAPDYETKNSYTATVTISDGTLSVTQSITVNVTDVDETLPNVAPVITSSATFSAAENQTSIGSVSASDADGDSLTYSISGSEINISSSGSLFFATAPDYETKNSYTTIVTVSDGTASVTQSITVNVTDVDETLPNVAPVITSSATFSAAENQTSIGSVSASDADGDSLTYSISGSEINISSSGVLTFDSAPDYETKNSYTTTVTVSDGTASVTQSITVNVTDVDETLPNVAPVITSSATFSAAENQTSIGSVSASDADGDSLTYSISGSEINISSSGVLTFDSPPDYETKNSYTTIVTVSDGTASVTQSITVNVTDVNENVAPVITSSATFSAAENQRAIGSVTATDANGDALTYSTEGQEINISSSGVLTFDSAPDYETKNSYTTTVTVSDGTASVTQSITVNVTDVNENVAPVITSSATFSAAENQTSIGSVSASDADGDSLTYSISGSEINISSSGVLTFDSAPDYETKNSYTTTVTVSDGTASVTQSITVNVTDINEAPTITSSATFSVNENIETIGGTVSASDPEGDSLTYSISGSEINISSSGVLTFASAPDYETKNAYSATVTVSDGTNSTTQTITVNITDIANEHTPVFLNNGLVSGLDYDNCPSEENLTSGGCLDEGLTPTLTYPASDADGDTLTWSLISNYVGCSIPASETDEDLFSINSSTGAVNFNFVPDFENPRDTGSVNDPGNNPNDYRFGIKVSDGELESRMCETIYISNINDNTPTWNVSSAVIAENNQTALYVFGNKSMISDADGNLAKEYQVGGSAVNADADVHSNTSDFSISLSGPDANRFYLGGGTGLSGLFFGPYPTNAPDFENPGDVNGDNVYEVTLTASDSNKICRRSPSNCKTVAANSTSINLTITITDIPSPTISGLGSSISAAENQTSVVTVAASSAIETGRNLVYSLTGADASSLSINSSGVITFNSAPDYETKSSYSVNVKVAESEDSDPTNAPFVPEFTIQALTVNVTNINEFPTISSSATFSAAENQNSIGSISASDPEGDSLTYSISGSEINISSSGVLTFATAPDYETKNSYTETVTVSDGTNSTTQTITVNITDVSE